MDQLLYGASSKYTHGVTGREERESIFIAKNNQKLIHFLLDTSVFIYDVVMCTELLFHKEL